MTKIIQTADYYSYQYPVSVVDWFEETSVRKFTFDTVKKLIGTEANLEVLDWGCGNGMWDIGLFPNSQIVGIELDQQTLSYAETNAIYNKVKFVGHVVDNKLEYINKFDIATNFGLIEFLNNEEFENIFCKIYASLKADGLLFCTFFTWRPFSAAYLPYSIKALLHKKSPYNYYSDLVGCYISDRSFNSVITQLESIGFELIDAGGINPYPSWFWKFVKSPMLFKIRNKILKHWCCAYYIKLKKV